jgi:predicted Zn-dependent peptidase
VLLKNKSTDQTHLIFGFKGSPLGSPSRYAEAVLAAILGGGMSSRLFTEVREKRGLAYSVKTTPDHALDNGYFASYAGVKTEAVDEAIKIIKEEHYLLANGKKPISKKELVRSKEYIKGHLALSLEDSKELGDFFALEELMLRESKTPEEVYREIDKVSQADILEVARKFFKPERLNLAIIGPFKDKSRFEKLLN